MSTAVVAPPLSPFKGLAAFDDSDTDALFFFGRDRERKLVVANLFAARMTLLYGPSGVGKSSLLAAAVVRDLREAAHGAPVVLRSTWSGELGDVCAELRDAGDGFLILDQFEEYFLYHAEDGAGPLSHVLADLLATTDANVLIALREDSLARLSAFKAQIPTVFANQFRLKHLGVEQARRAVLGPLRRWTELTGEHVDAEPAFVETVVDDVATHEGIEAPYLQLVLERVWEAEREAGSSLLRRETLDRLGGAAAIVRDQFRGALDALPAEQQAVAAAMFEHLVTPTGTKIALDAEDLGEYAHVDDAALRAVLNQLTRDRIIHAVDGTDRYEIFHDVLAEPIGAWRIERRFAAEQAASRRRQRRLLALAAGALVALAVVAALAVWALSERGSARTQARDARAHELLARSAEQLAVDPRASVALAVAAAKLAPNASAETALRDALLADQLRTTVHVPAPVESVATSPDGNRFAAVDGPHTILVGDARTGRVTQRLRGPDRYVSVGFRAPHGVVAANGKGVATLWASGRPTHDGQAFARAHDGSVVLVPYRGALARALPHSTHVRATPDGRFVAAAVESPDGRVRASIFGRGGRLLRVLPDIGIHGIDLSPDGRSVVTASALGNATIWDLRTGKRIRVFADSARSVADAAFNPRGSLLATSGSDGVVRVWTVRDGGRLFYLTGQTSPDGMLAWSGDGRLLASANRDRTVRVWGIEGVVEVGAEAATLHGARDAVHSLAFAADGRRLVAGSEDGTVRIWDSNSDQELSVVARFAKPVLGAAFAGPRIVAGAADGSVAVLDARTHRVLRSIRSPVRARSFAVSQNGSVVAAGPAVFDTRTGRLLSRSSSDATVVGIDPAGRLAVAGSTDGRVRAWQTHGGRVRWTAPQGSVSDVRFAPGGSVVAVADGSGVTLRSAATGRALHRISVPGGVVRVAFSPDGSLLATADVDATARIFSTATGALYRMLRGHGAPLTDVAFSSDGVLLATSAHDSEARIWNVARGRGIAILRGTFGEVGSIAFSPDRRWVVTGGPISAALWPMSSGRLLFYLRGDTELVTSISFSPDGRTILSGSVDGTVRTYRCDVCGGLDDLRRLAARALARSR